MISRLIKRNLQNSLPKGTEIVLHIGAPKTGTSAIQRLLLSQRSKLRSCGFYYPVHGLDSNGVSGGHSDIGKALLEGDLAKGKLILDSYIQEAKKNNLVLLLSAESFYRFPEQFSKMLVDKRVYVICFTRNPLDSIRSNYNQLVKRHFSNLTLKEFCNQVMIREDPYLTGDILFKWKELFSKEMFRVIPYIRKGKLSNYSEIKLLESIGLPKTIVSTKLRNNTLVNKSYTPSALEFKRLVNCSVDRSFSEFHDSLDLILQKYSDESDEVWTSTKSLVEPELFEKMNEYFIEKVQRIESTFDISIIDSVEAEEKKIDSSAFFYRSYSLETVADYLERSDPFLMKTLKELVEALLSISSPGYHVLRLSEVLRIEKGLNKIKFIPFMNQNEVNVFLSPNSKKPDFLRELSKICIRHGKKELALDLISKAHELRPTGPTIQEIKEKLEKELT